MTIRIDQPLPFDLVGNPILIGGVGTGFEATLNYRVHEGHDEVTGFFTVGGGTGEHGQYQLQVDVAGAAFTLDRVFVEVFEISAADGSEINKALVPVILGPRLVANYIGYREHVVLPGDTLWAIAAANYGNGSEYPLIVRANPTLITDPDVIFPGQVLKIPIGA
ncbi:MAG TPA: Gmad2 immunoglobulin-like domain-containing protein [Acidimicrobiales bacterium]|nr:Gmad2 immunoglobulin-like domain-containing protein [Acidimicrobiales bacterium]